MRRSMLSRASAGTKGMFLAGLGIAGWAGLLRGQATSNWDDYIPCQQCDLELDPVVRMGDADGPGIIEGGDVFVRWHEVLGYLVYIKPSAGPVKIFDHSGQFLRLLGRSGEGPGEIGGIVDANFVGDRIVVLDWRKHSWLSFDRSGQSLGQARHSMVRTGDFIPLDGDHIVLAAGDRQPDYTVQPLHVVNVVTGEAVRHFGTVEANWEADPYSRSVAVSGVSANGTVWVGKAARPTIAEWSVDGEPVQSIAGELPWFSPVTRYPEIGKEEPPTLLRSLAISQSGQLWMLTSIADPGWRDAELTTLGAEVVIEQHQADGYRDSRLDVFDLEDRRHVGFRTWDSAGVRLLNLSGEPAVSVLAYTDQMVPQVAVFRARFK